MAQGYFRIFLMPPDCSANAWAGRRGRGLGVCWQLWLSLEAQGDQLLPVVLSLCSHALER